MDAEHSRGPPVEPRDGSVNIRLNPPTCRAVHSRSEPQVLLRCRLIESSSCRWSQY